MVTRLDIEQVRADISKISDTLNLMENDALDTAAVQLMLSRKKFELQNLIAWRGPERGPYHVAINAKVYEARQAEIDGFLGEPIWKDSHRFGFNGVGYEVFSFVNQADADRFMAAFNGEPFDYRDAGSGKNWMKWYKGRAANREKNRSPYDFGK